MKYSFRMQYHDVITNPRWRTDAILKIVFWLYLGAILTDQSEIWNRDEGSHADVGHLTKTAISANSRWRTAAILKIALSPYLSRELTDIDQIWYTNTNIQSEHGNLIKKMKFFKFKMADGRHIQNLFFGNISVPYWPIYANFGMEMKNHRQISVTWPKWQFSQIQDGGGPPYWKYPYLSRNYPISSKFGMQMQISIPRMAIWQKNSKFFKSKMADGRHIENRFFAISRRLIGQSTRNSKRRWRITCQYRSLDQNCNFPKLKMAEGRDFENSFRCLRDYCNELMFSSVFQ